MIQRLNHNNIIDISEFVKNTSDNYREFYITINKERIFINNLDIISKLLKTQAIYAIIEHEIKAILIIYKEKGFRSYLKFLIKEKDNLYDLLKYLKWNINEDLYIKIKKNNPAVEIIQKFDFRFLGSRGTESLFVSSKKEIKQDDHYTHKD